MDAYIIGPLLPGKPRWHRCRGWCMPFAQHGTDRVIGTATRSTMHADDDAVDCRCGGARHHHRAHTWMAIAHTHLSTSPLAATTPPPLPCSPQHTGTHPLNQPPCSLLSFHAHTFARSFPHRSTRQHRVGRVCARDRTLYASRFAYTEACSHDDQRKSLGKSLPSAVVRVLPLSRCRGCECSRARSNGLPGWRAYTGGPARR